MREWPTESGESWIQHPSTLLTLQIKSNQIYHSFHFIMFKNNQHKTKINTYHFLGCFRGLYFLNLIFHSICSLHRVHTPPTVILFRAFVWWLVSCMSFLNAIEFWYFCCFFFMFPFCELIFPTYRRFSLFQKNISFFRTVKSSILHDEHHARVFRKKVLWLVVWPLTVFFFCPITNDRGKTKWQRPWGA